MRNAKPLPVHKRSLSACAGEHFIAPGVVDRATKDLPRFLESDRDGKEGKLMGKIRCSIQGIDDPLPLIARLGAGDAGLFGENGMRRGSFHTAAHDERFACSVRSCHYVGSSFPLTLFLAV